MLCGLEGDADVVVMLGTRSISEASPRPGPYFRKASFVAHVNADPSRLEGTRRVDWVSASDPGAFAQALLGALEAEPPAAEVLAARGPWLERKPPAALDEGALGRTLAGHRRAVASMRA
jgi:thiamine pyrophosphate-dependent acetolactate synthase large subunit-like protein